MRWLLATLLIATALSGCAQAPTDDASVDDIGFVPGDLEDVLAALDAGNTSANLERLGAWEVSGEEADAWEDYIAVDAGSAVSILQRTLNGTALEFTEVAHIDGGFTAKDVKFSDDGEWLFIGDDTQASATALGGTPSRAGGFYTYFVGDKSAPELTQFLPVGPVRGPHMVAYHMAADGTEMVFGANGDISVNVFDRDSGTLAETARYQPATTEVNRNPDVIDAYYQVYAHDMFPMTDNVTGQELLYVANWDAGLRIVDVSDPRNINEIGGWNEFPEGHSGNLHTVATEWIGGKRITAGAVEVGFDIVGGKPYATNTEHAVVYVWDTTDPGDIQLLGVWENPFDYRPGRVGTYTPASEVFDEPLYSTHNIQLEGGRIYLAHYELGVWVLDISTPQNQTAPQVVAYDLDTQGEVWDVIVAGGTIFTSGNGGLIGSGFPLIERGPDGIYSRN